MLVVVVIITSQGSGADHHHPPIHTLARSYTEAFFFSPLARTWNRARQGKASRARQGYLLFYLTELMGMDDWYRGGE